MTLPLAKVERELAHLRLETAKANDSESMFPHVRASVATLVAWAGEGGDAEAVRQVAAEVSPRHPCRSVVVVPGPGAVEAEVTVQCTLAPSAEHQVCVEQVVLHGGSDAQAASAVEQLLLHDVPVVLWWVDGVPTNSVGRLLDQADRLVVDTAGPKGFNTAERLLDIVRERAHLWVADLDWVRLTPWRRAVAGAFEAPEARARLSAVEAVRVQSPHRLRACLLAGWVVDRLDLRGADLEVDVAQGDAGVLEIRTKDEDFVIPGTASEAPLADVLGEELAQVTPDHAYLGALPVALDLLGP